MGDEGVQTLYTTDDTGSYVEYTPPEAPAFKDTLPEDIRGSEHLGDVEDPAQLARYYVDLKSDYLAAPETPDGYDVEESEGFTPDPDQLTQFKSMVILTPCSSST